MPINEYQKLGQRGTKRFNRYKRGMNKKMRNRTYD